jgi:hypothetical protein
MADPIWRAVQGAPRARAKAHRRLLRGVRDELEAVLEQERVCAGRFAICGHRYGLISCGQVAADATRLVGHLKKMLRG